jgi:acetoin utilization deacetylase AcuC-like enzyme
MEKAGSIGLNGFRVFIQVMPPKIMSWRADMENPPVLFVLEGGYSPRALAASVKAVVLSLLNPRRTRPRGPETQLAADLAARARNIHQSYGIW